MGLMAKNLKLKTEGPPPTFILAGVHGFFSVSQFKIFLRF